MAGDKDEGGAEVGNGMELKVLGERDVPDALTEGMGICMLSQGIGECMNKD